MAFWDNLTYLKAGFRVDDLDKFFVRYQRLVQENRLLPSITQARPGQARGVVLAPYSAQAFWREYNHARQLSQIQRNDLDTNWKTMIQHYIAGTATGNHSGEAYFVLDDPGNNVKELMFVDFPATAMSISRSGVSWAWSQNRSCFG